MSTHSSVTTTTVQAFLNSTVMGVFNTSTSTSTVAAMASAQAISAVTSSSSSTTTQTCKEWGDGAGPCTRPYGAPNTPPLSVIGALTKSANMSMSPAGSLTTFQNTTTEFAAASATMSADAITGSSSADGCAVTATVYVTITGSSGDSGSTTTSTSTIQVTTVTATLPDGPSGPQTITETLSLGANASTVANKTTSGHASVTLSPITLTMTSHNATYTATSSSSPTSATSTIPLLSGGNKAAGKPLGANGSASGTGNGLYCVVMLVSLLALLI